MSRNTYTIILDDNNRCLYYYWPSQDNDKITVDKLPNDGTEHSLEDYVYKKGKFVYDPLPVSNVKTESKSITEEVEELKTAVADLQKIMKKG